MLKRCTTHVVLLSFSRNKRLFRCLFKIFKGFARRCLEVLSSKSVLSSVVAAGFFSLYSLQYGVLLS